MPLGDRLFFLDNLARISMTSIEDIYDSTVDDDFDFEQLKIVSKGLKRFKEISGIIDFTDLLYKYLEEGFQPKLKALFVDEAQDLSRLQWNVIHKLVRMYLRYMLLAMMIKLYTDGQELQSQTLQD